MGIGKPFFNKSFDFGLVLIQVHVKQHGKKYKNEHVCNIVPMINSLDCRVDSSLRLQYL